MRWSSLLAVAPLAQALPQRASGGGATLLRFACSQVVIERLDPYVSRSESAKPGWAWN